MSCKCAKYEPDEGRYNCSISGDGCMYLIPNSKRCAIDYGEGPDAGRDPAELLAELEAERKKPNTEIYVGIDYAADDADDYRSYEEKTNKA